MTRALAFMLLISVAGSVGGASPLEPGRELLVVRGIGGEAFYEDLFHRWASGFVESAQNVLGLDGERITYLAEDPTRDPQIIRGHSRKWNIHRAIEDIAERTGTDDLVMIVLIGHGSARGDRILFNLPGPDLAAGELDEWLQALSGRRIAVVNTSSSSGPFVQALSRPGRVIITATANGAENHHAAFGGHFVYAFGSLAADSDKDGRVSLLEAFVFASRQVQRAFQERRVLQTEHALLDDDGDRVGTMTPSKAGPDGMLAARWHVASLASGPPRGAQERLELEISARAIVDRIEHLKREKTGLTREEYEDDLEGLLIELAQNRRLLRKVAQ